MKALLGIIGGSLLLGSPAAQAYDINAYAVANHRRCNVSNLPATIQELNRFFSSSFLPQEARKNLYYKDTRVLSSHWKADEDFVDSGTTANGKDGVDSAFLSYIASHGVTYSAMYVASSGNRSNDGCEMNSKDMSIGDHEARYLILSTCQGLKIGTGDNPNRTGDDPSITWATAAKGLNCIYGYSNNMVDSSGYGEYFLKNLATSDETLAEAFLRASRQVHYSNIPAVLCFGSDEAAARASLENDREFRAERNAGAASVWTYGRAVRQGGAFTLPQKVKFPVVVASDHFKFDGDKLKAELLGAKIKTLKTKPNLMGYRSEKGSLLIQNGVVHWQKAGKSFGSVMSMKDAEVIHTARRFLQRKQLVGGIDLVPSYIINHGTKVNGKRVLTDKTVVFHQQFAGVMPLGTAGSVEVKVNGNGGVVKLVAALRQFKNLREPTFVEVADASLIGTRINIAKSRLVQKLPGAKLSLVDVRLGYDTGSYYESRDRSRAVVEVLIEAKEGAFSRRYLEVVPL